MVTPTLTSRNHSSKSESVKKRNHTCSLPAFLLTDMAEPRIPVRINPLLCQICSLFLRNPVTVPCGHNFCMQCIQECWDHADRINCDHSCPDCGRVFPSRPHLIKNTTLAELVKDTDKCCNGAEKRKQQSGAAPLKRPRSCAESSTPGSFLCEKHNSTQDVYCCTDHNIEIVNLERRKKQVSKKAQLLLTFS